MLNLIIWFVGIVVVIFIALFVLGIFGDSTVPDKKPLYPENKDDPKAR